MIYHMKYVNQKLPLQKNMERSWRLQMTREFIHANGTKTKKIKRWKHFVNILSGKHIFQYLGKHIFTCTYLRAYQENSACIVEQRNVVFHRDMSKFRF